ncbi:peptidase M24, structural domain-containing protein [Lanmaoa asiatica]|nr:peptidase M24, structural domain-containing protein [Lanmaoa asiatica]
MGAIGTERVDTSERLGRLRALMRQQDINVGAVVVPSEDEHSSEYPSEADKRRAFISGFNGSAGCAVITLKDAFLFTDGRYFLQAQQQLDDSFPRYVSDFVVLLQRVTLAQNLDQGTRIGIDPTLILATDAQTLNKSLEESELVPLLQNPVDIVWGSERPQRPKNPVFVLDVKYSGENLRSKLHRTRQELAKKNAVALAVTLLDEVAWLFNLRGTDIDFNPAVFFAYAVVKQDSAVLFIDKAQIGDTVLTHFDQDVEIRPYEAFLPYLKDLVETGLVKQDKPVLLGDKTSFAVVQALGEENVVTVPSPVAAMKTIENSTEIEGFRQCHIRDGVALARYFAWLEEQLHNGVVLNESQGSDKLEEFRSEHDLFRGLSFPTISSAGPNAAIIHYSPDPNNCAIITKDQVSMLHNRCQYLDGTTDHFGTPSGEEKRAFTRVLQGHITLDSAVFPTGTTGRSLDHTWARRALWRDGLGELSLISFIGINIFNCDSPDYRHGTGHGVGHFLNVHEGMCGNAGRPYNSTALKPGMTLSNEPGYYADGKWGIRIENVVIVREVKTPNNFGGNGYLGFERVTMCPIQTSLIDFSVLTNEEKKWLNDYHAEVESKVAPLLEGKDARALAWLKRQCQAV